MTALSSTLSLRATSSSGFRKEKQRETPPEIGLLALRFAGLLGPNHSKQVSFSVISSSSFFDA